MARIALVSVLHGNLHATERVLADIDARGVDAIACLGDVATLGPRPREVASLVRERADYTILGNHDAYMLDPDLHDPHDGGGSGPLGEAVAWCREELVEADRAFFRTFRDRVELDLGGAPLLLFHGSPDSNLEEIDAATATSRLDVIVDAHPATVLAGGHTHLQLLRQHRGRWFVNPGSVGVPFARAPRGSPPTILAHAEYAIVEGNARSATVSLHRVALDGARLRAQTRGWRVALARDLVTAYASAP